MLDWLKERQAEAGLRDDAFAAFLGISRPYWLNVKAGRREVGDFLRVRVLRAYPDRCQEILALERDE